MHIHRVFTIRKPIPIRVENEGSFFPVIKESKICSCKSSAIPGPLSATERRQNFIPSSSFSNNETLIFPWLGVYLNAFDKRFFNADSIFHDLARD